ncbi:putative membrane protein [Anaplasma phagocytophilum str. ApMUC09]|uniref:Putative membrane protein n=1 Tax=Anaplasma phagocytophilum str. ApMUC09 TaxID=1359152 RepID=A0A0F3N9J7_ANAPH|nr:putative membrane protein [Anaplasma phagocytophilum str. ApMUC09]
MCSLNFLRYSCKSKVICVSMGKILGVCALFITCFIHLSLK